MSPAKIPVTMYRAIPFPFPFPFRIHTHTLLLPGLFFSLVVFLCVSGCPV